MLTDRIDPRAVATINVTILAIGFAAAGVWAAVIIGNRHRMTHEAIEAATRVNEVSFVADHNNQTAPMLKSYDPRNKDSRDAMLSAIDQLLAGDNPEPPQDRAVELWRRMTALLESYPFANRVKVQQHEGSDIVMTLDPELVPFGDVGEIRKWSEAMTVLEPHFWLWTIQKAEMSKVFSALAAQRPWANLRPELFGEAGEELAQFMVGPSNVPTSFLAAIQQAAQVHALVRLKLGELDRYTGRLPARGRLVSAMLLGGAAFFAGVLVPMLWTDPPAWLFAWLPAAVYVLLFAGLLGWVVRRYQP